MIVKTDEQGFKKITQSGSVSLIKFTADWCRYCKLIQPMLNQLSQELENKAIVAEVDVDECGELASQYGVMAIPTIIVFKDGKEVKRMVNVTNKAEYIKAVDELLAQ